MPPPNPPLLHVHTFHQLLHTPYAGEANAICWERSLAGNFEEVVNALPFEGNILELSETLLATLSLSSSGQEARAVLLNDLRLLREHGASPVLNLIKSYARDAEPIGFPTDVYSFHVDRSPIPTDTFLCTYYGDTSELLPNAQAEQKVLVPEIRRELRQLYPGPEDGFEAFLEENFFDLHYRPKPGATPIRMGIGHLWRLAVDHPESSVQPCVHRAPEETSGKTRLLLIC